MKGDVARLALKLRYKTTRKWPNQISEGGNVLSIIATALAKHAVLRQKAIKIEVPN